MVHSERRSVSCIETKQDSFLSFSFQNECILCSGSIFHPLTTSEVKLQIESFARNMAWLGMCLCDRGEGRPYISDSHYRAKHCQPAVLGSLSTKTFIPCTEPSTSSGFFTLALFISSRGTEHNWARKPNHCFLFKTSL